MIKTISLFLFTLVSSCSRSPSSSNDVLVKINTSVFHGIKRLKTKDCPPQSLVADVNGYAVTVADVEKLMKNKGLSSSEAIEKAVADELVWQESLKKFDPDILNYFHKAVAAWYLIEQDFEKKYNIESIPDEKLKDLYDNIQGPAYSASLTSIKFYFGHSEWRQGIQLVVNIKDIPDKENMESVLSMMRLVKSSANSSNIVTDNDFGNLAWNLQNSYFRVGFENALPPLSKKKIENRLRFGRDFDSFFIEKLFEAPSEGEIMDPFITKYGAHFVYLKKIIPEFNKSFEESKEELKKKMGMGWLIKSFEKWISEKRSKYNYRIYL
ncbi:hypothetical protein KKF34_18845 [Myxococcota bacterium]|nr:hypothetical protein [Myxococcota bacterium]MBU1380811.1 hypothetical protein [Myxococcota bacterium]MBU1498945.1 hypothetical protein [Myxococcota bacterium]